MRFHIITVVWGEEFSSLFTGIAIPNQLSAGNLPAFGPYDAIYKIYTTAEDFKRIEQTSAYQNLLKTMPVEVVLIDRADSGDASSKYALMTKCHKLAMQDAKNNNAALIFLAPDVIYSDGSFANLLKIARTGKRAIMNAVLRVKKENIVPILLERFYSAEDNVICIGPDRLVELTMAHLHPLSKTCLWNSNKFIGWPCYLYFDVPGEGLLARCFMLHPLMINIHKENLSFEGALDTNYIADLHPKDNDIHVVTDSDEILMIEMSKTSDHADKLITNYFSARKVAIWAGYYASLYHRKFIKQKIRFHVGAMSSRWIEIEKLSDKMVNKIFRWYKFERALSFPSRLLFKVRSIMKNNER